MVDIACRAMDADGAAAPSEARRAARAAARSRARAPRVAPRAARARDSPRSNPMRLIRRAAVLGAAATLAAGLVTVVSRLPAEAHGTPMAPGSRTFLCWKDGLSPQGDIEPNNPACAAAVAAGRHQPALQLVQRAALRRRRPHQRLHPGRPAVQRRQHRPSPPTTGPQRLAADPPDRRRAVRLQVQQLGPPPGHVLLLRHQGRLEPDPAAGLETTWRRSRSSRSPTRRRTAGRAPTRATTTSAATCRRARAAGTSSTRAGCARTARRTSSAAPTSSSTAATAR